MELKVAACISESDAATNTAFVKTGIKISTGEVLNRFNYLLTNTVSGEKCVYRLTTKPDCPEGVILLNKYQRLQLKAAFGDKIRIEECSPVEPAKCVSLDIEAVNYTEIQMLHSKNIIEYFKTQYSGHCVKGSQVVPLVISPRVYTLTVNSFLPYNNYVLITQNSEIIFENTHTIHFVDSKVSQTSLSVPTINFSEIGIGGLDTEFMQIIRRAFMSRMWPIDIIQKTGLQHTKGVLLYGLPGCGKTRIARTIGKMLNCKDIKSVSGPEMLNKYVGGSEEKIRNLFIEAEQEQKQKGALSGLHLVIIDELDAVCRKRGSSGDSSGVHDSVVDQLLAKMDGEQQLNNILIIGMTNRKELIDEALLRPGRFDIHIYIPLPNLNGRKDIFKIHTKDLSKNNILDTIDFDLLASLTENYSGAEIEGVVKAALSYSMQRHIDTENINKPKNTDQLKLTQEDLLHALNDIHPAFGQTDDLKKFSNSIFIYSDSFSEKLNYLNSLRDKLFNGNMNTLSLLLYGKSGSGTTTIAVDIAKKSSVPFIRIISPDLFIGKNYKSALFSEIISDASKSPKSILIIDNIERIIEYIGIGPRFNSDLLQCLLILLNKSIPSENKLMIIGTTSNKETLNHLDINFDFSVEIPELSPESQLKFIESMGMKNPPKENSITIKSLIYYLTFES